jgi:hypothetical protein
VIFTGSAPLNTPPPPRFSWDAEPFGGRIFEAAYIDAEPGDES